MKDYAELEKRLEARATRLEIAAPYADDPGADELARMEAMLSEAALDRAAAAAISDLTKRLLELKRDVVLCAAPISEQAVVLRVTELADRIWRDDQEAKLLSRERASELRGDQIEQSVADAAAEPEE